MKREKGASAIRAATRAGAAVGAGWLLAACSTVNPDGAPPTEIRSAIDTPYDHRIFFRDEERKHVVSLHDDGSYLFKSGTDAEGVISTREGRWSWKKTGSHYAELTLDSNVWKLTFVSPDSAVAVNQSAAGRTYAFQFEPM